MISKHIKHYLTTEGKQFLPSWLQRLQQARHEVPGFKDILLGKESGDEEATHLILLFQDQSALDRWIDNATHRELLAALQGYLYRPSEIQTFEFESLI